MSAHTHQHTDKVSIIGCGRVGMTAAYALVLGGQIDELILLGRNKNKIIGEELDLEHGSPYLRPCHVTSTDTYSDIKDSQVVVVTAGVSQQPGETRLDLAKKNLEIIENIIPQITRHAPHANILIVSNPVDVLTYRAYQISDLPKGQIFGSGTTLDSARFRFHLSEYLDINPKSIHAYVLGEHGDTSFPVLSSATVGGQPLLDFPDFSPEKAYRAYTKARDAAYKIIASKGATFYGIGVVVARIVETILKDAKTVLPVSIPLHNYHGLNGIALSVPCIIGRAGVEKTLKIKLSAQERGQLFRSARVVKSYL